MNPTLALLLRHGFAAFSGFLLQHGIAADASSTASLIAGLVVYIAVCVCSAFGKAELSDSNKQIAQKLAGIFASQFLSAVAGWLQASAGDVGDPVALSILLGNTTLAKVRSTPTGGAVVKQWTGLFLLSAFSFQLCSCGSLTKQDAITYGQRVGLFAGDAAIVLAHMQLESAEADLASAQSQPGANKAEIAMKRLAVATAKQALAAATAAIAKQRAKLDAKQPREGVTPQKEGSAVTPDRNTPPPCDEPREQIPACLRVVAIPDYGARVAAMR